MRDPYVFKTRHDALRQENEVEALKCYLRTTNNAFKQHTILLENGIIYFVKKS